MRIDERVFFALGVVLSLVAFGFGLNRAVYLQGEGTSPRVAPNLVAAAAAAGFAVEGGMCFLASALVGRGRQPGDGPRGDRPARPGE